MATGEILIGGFGDGQVRVCCLHIPDSLPSEEGLIKLTLSQVSPLSNQKIFVNKVVSRWLNHTISLW